MTDYGNSFLLDSGGDMQFNDLKRIVMAETNAEKVLQDVRITLKTILSGDMFAPQFGLDLLKIKQYRFNNTLIDAEIRTALKKYRYLKSIDSIIIADPDADRNVNVDVSITTTENLQMTIGVAF